MPSTTTSTTPSPTTTTTPPPSACPCNAQTLSASITTKYFTELLEMGSLFHFPIDIVLQKNENADCQYIGQTTQKLLFYDRSNTLDITPAHPEEIKTATLSAALTWDDDLDIWTFVWSTNFQNVSHSEELTLSQETPSCPYGTFVSDLEDELVCVKDPNSLEEIPDTIDILYYNEELFGVDIVAYANSEDQPLGNYGRSVSCIKLYKYTSPTIKEGLIYRSYPIWLDPRTFDREINIKSPYIDDYIKIFELFINKCSGKKIFKIYTELGANFRDLKHNDVIIDGIVDAEPGDPPFTSWLSTNYGVLDEESEFQEFFSQDESNKNLEFIRIIPENVNTEKICGLCKHIYTAKSLSIFNRTKSNCEYLKEIYSKDLVSDLNEQYYLNRLASNGGNMPILPLLDIKQIETSLLANKTFILIGADTQLTYDKLIAPIRRPNGRRTFIPTGSPQNPSPILVPIGPDFGDIDLKDFYKQNPSWANYWSIFETKLSVKVPPPHNTLVDNMFEYAFPFVKDYIEDLKYGWGPEPTFDVSDYYSGYVFYPTMDNVNFSIIVDNTKHTETIPLRELFEIVQGVNDTGNIFEAFKYQGYGIIDFPAKCIHFRLYWFVNNDFIKSILNLPRRNLEKDKFISIPTFGDIKISFQGDDGDTSVVDIYNQEFIVKNDNDQLVFDFEGDQEYTFTEIGETHTITVSDLNYDIVFDGLGSLLFSVIPETIFLNNFSPFITESAYGVDIVELEPLYLEDVPDNLSQNIEIGFNTLIDEEELTGNKIRISVQGVILEIDEAYDQSLFCIIKKDINQVIYFIFDKMYAGSLDFIVDFYVINNTETKFCGVTLTDYTKVPNSLPQTTSSNGVEIVELVDGYTGISFNPIDDSQLVGNSIEVTVEGNVFLIDEAYDGRTFVLNELRTPTNNKSTLFTFLLSLSYGINVFRTSSVIDPQFLRMRLLGYY